MIWVFLPHLLLVLIGLAVLLTGVAIGYRLGKARTVTKLVFPTTKEITIDVSDARIRPRAS